MKHPLPLAIWALPTTDPGSGGEGQGLGTGLRKTIVPGLGSAADKPETTIPRRRSEGGGWSWPSGSFWL